MLMNVAEVIVQQAQQDLVQAVTLVNHQIKGHLFFYMQALTGENF